MELPESSTDGPSAADAGDADTFAEDAGAIAQTPEAKQDDKIDHRHLGDWGSRYERTAWVQIGFEFGYLVVILLTCTAGLVWVGYHVAPPAPLDQRAISFLGIPFEYPRDRTFFLWVSVGLSGMVGGSCFALKWLYHSVAKALWNRDRVLWRLIVPVLSGTVAVFVSMLVASGLLSLIDVRFFSNFYGAVGVGWLVGYFSDNVLASLQKLAHKWFGTVDERRDSSGKGSAPKQDGT